MFSRMSSRARYTKGELKSPDFTLPDLEKSPAVIRYGFFNWKVEPYIENTERTLKLTCSLCPKVYHSKWPINTSTLKSHIHNSHPDVVVKLQEDARNPNIPARDKIPSDVLGPPPRTNRKSANRSVAITDVLSMDYSQANRKRQNRFQFDEGEFQRLLTEMVISNNIPMHTVNSPHFKELISLVSGGRNISLKSSSVFSDVEDMYKKEVDLLKLHLAKNKSRFAVTMDVFKTNNKLDFFAMVLHFYNDKFEHEQYTIGFHSVQNVNGYTVMPLYEGLFHALKEYDTKDRLISITKGDSGRLSEYFDIYEDAYEKKDLGPGFQGEVRCARNVIKLAAETFLKSTFFKNGYLFCYESKLSETAKKYPEVEEIYIGILSLPTSIRAIIKALGCDEFFIDTFEALVSERKPEEKFKKGHKILFGDKNGKDWHSTFKMVDRFLHFREEITELLRQFRIVAQSKQGGYEFDEDEIVEEITDKEWDYLLIVRDVLQIFCDFPAKFKKYEFASINYTTPLIFQLLKQLEDGICFSPEMRNPYINVALRASCDTILQYYPVRGTDIEPIKDVYLTIAIDPRLKLGYLRDVGVQEKAIKDTEDYFCTVYDRYKQEYEAEKQLSEESNNEIRVKIQEEDCVDSGEHNYDEIISYLQEKRESETTDVVAFYKRRESSFPIIYRIARDYLAVPGISARKDSFPGAVDLILSRANRHTPKEINMLTVLKSRGVISEEQFSETDEEEIEEDEFGERKNDPKDHAEDFIVVDDDHIIINDD